MPSPNINTTDTLEQGRQKINAHFNDATQHGSNSIGGTNLGWINVKDHGAVGNGTTDDRAALQAASNAAAAARKALYFPPGRYAISASLVPSHGSVYYTDSYSARYGGGNSVDQDSRSNLPVQILPHSSFPSTGILVDARNKRNMRWEGIEVRGNGTNSQNGTTIGLALGTYNQTNEPGWHLWGNHVFHHCSFVRHARGVAAKESQYNEWFGVQFSECKNYGAYFASFCGDARYIECNWNTNGWGYNGADEVSTGVGMYVGLSSGESRIIGGKVENNVYGLHFEDSFGVNVVGVNFHNSSGRHVRIDSRWIEATMSVNFSGCRMLGGGYRSGHTTANKYHIYGWTGNSAPGFPTRLNLSVTGCVFRKSYNEGWDYATDYQGSTADHGPVDGVFGFDGNGILTASIVGNECEQGAITSRLFVATTVNSQSRITASENTGLSYVLPTGVRVHETKVDNRSTATGTIGLTMSDKRIQRFTATLTGNVTVNLPSSGMSEGDEFWIQRVGAGSFTLTVNTATPKVFTSASTGWVRCVYDGTNWQNAGAGTL